MHPIAASGFLLASRGSEITVVAIAVIAEASLANCGDLPSLAPVSVRSLRLVSAVEPETSVFLGDCAYIFRGRRIVRTHYLCAR